MFGLYQPKLGKLPKSTLHRTQVLPLGSNEEVVVSDETLKMIAKFLEQEETKRTSEFSILKQRGLGADLYSNAIRSTTPPKFVTFNEIIIEHDSQWDAQTENSQHSVVDSIEFEQHDQGSNIEQNDHIAAFSFQDSIVERLEKIVSKESLRLEPNEVVSFGEMEDFPESSSIQCSEDFNYNLLENRMYQEPTEYLGDEAVEHENVGINDQQGHSKNLTSIVLASEHFYPPPNQEATPSPEFAFEYAGVPDHFVHGDFTQDYGNDFLTFTQEDNYGQGYFNDYPVQEEVHEELGQGYFNDYPVQEEVHEELGQGYDVNVYLTQEAHTGENYLIKEDDGHFNLEMSNQAQPVYFEHGAPNFYEEQLHRASSANILKTLFYKETPVDFNREKPLPPIPSELEAPSPPSPPYWRFRFSAPPQMQVLQEPIIRAHSAAEIRHILNNIPVRSHSLAPPRFPID